MLASDYIIQLKALIAEHGDLECRDANDEAMGYPEYNEDGAPVFILADRA